MKMIHDSNHLIQSTQDTYYTLLFPHSVTKVATIFTSTNNAFRKEWRWKNVSVIENMHKILLKSNEES